MLGRAEGRGGEEQGAWRESGREGVTWEQGMCAYDGMYSAYGCMEEAGVASGMGLVGAYSMCVIWNTSDNLLNGPLHYSLSGFAILRC